MNSQEIRDQLTAARDNYIELIKSELMGPGSEFSFPDAEHELISTSPLSRYSVGILFPQGDRIEQDNDETVIIGEDLPEEHSESVPVDEQEATEKNRDRSFQLDETADENLDEEIGMATQYKPSSMGITFLVKGKAEKIHCRVSFATYRNALIPDCIVPYVPENPETYTVPSELAHIMGLSHKRPSIDIEFYLSNYDAAREAERFVGRRFPFYNSLEEEIRKNAGEGEDPDKAISILCSNVPPMNAREGSTRRDIWIITNQSAIWQTTAGRATVSRTKRCISKLTI